MLGLTFFACDRWKEWENMASRKTAKKTWQVRRFPTPRQKPVQTEQTIWMTFDLGVQGDYGSLHAWLDEHKAVECGDGVARLTMSFRRDPSEELMASLKRGGIKFGLRDRIYVIYTRGGKARGRWLFGRRRRAAWEGSGSAPGETFGEEEG